MKYHVILFVVLFGWNLFMGVSGNVKSLSAEEIRVFFGTYDRDVATRGIYTSILDERAETLEEPTRAADISNSGFLIFSSDYQTLYAVCGENKDSIAAFRVENKSSGESEKSGETKESETSSASQTPLLSELNRLTGLGKSVCHLALDRTGGNLLTAHYGSSDFALFSINEDASLNREEQRQALEGSGPNAERQSCSHPHSVKLGAGDFFYVPDLGTDRIMIYRLDSAKHTFVPNDPPFTTVEPGSGPRHLCFLLDKKTAYSANELTSTVTAFHVLKTGELRAFQTLSTLPEGWKTENSNTVNTVAEVACTPDGRFLYVSNRGHDSLACFKLDQDGAMTLREIVPVHGKGPRHFAISPTGKHLLAANQESNSVSLFAIHPDSGKLEFLLERALPASPVCVLFDRIDASEDAGSELAALKELESLKKEPISENWNLDDEYPWTAMKKNVAKMDPKRFPEELILARMGVEKVDQLLNFVQLGFEMDKYSKDDENRDFVRQITTKAVRQYTELITLRFSSLEARELNIFQFVMKSALANVTKVLEWNATEPTLTLCRGWLLHYLWVVEQKDKKDVTIQMVEDPEARKFIDEGITQALKADGDFENQELLSNALIARAIWEADENQEQAIQDMELAGSINPQIADQIQDSKLLLFIQTQQYAKALELVDLRLTQLEKAEAEAETGTEAEPETEAETETEAEPETEAETGTEAEPETEAERMKPQLSDPVFKLRSLRLEILLEMKKWEEALADSEYLLNARPGNSSILRLELQALTQLAKFEEAVKVMDALIEENSLDPRYYSLRGQLYLALGQPEKALEDFSQAVLVDETCQDAWDYKVNTLLQLERFDEAQKEVQKRLKKTPDDVALLLQNALLFIQKKEYKKALEEGKKAETAAEKMKPEEDCTEEESAEKIATTKLAVSQFLANYYLMAGLHHEAVMYYEKCLKNDLNNPLTLNNYAWLLATSPDDDVRNGEKALEFAKKAVEIQPIPGYLSTLAAAYAETGNFEQAIQIINLAIEKATLKSPNIEVDEALLESLNHEKSLYEQRKSVRERTETYK